MLRVVLGNDFRQCLSIKNDHRSSWKVFLTFSMDPTDRCGSPYNRPAQILLNEFRINASLVQSKRIMFQWDSRKQAPSRTVTILE